MRVMLSKKLVFISKPRCGSTSVRRLLSPLMDPSAGDFAVDMAGQHPPYHPHITAPYLKKLLAADGIAVNELSFFITLRHPLDMLWSYYKFFQPDAQSRYSFSPTWAGQAEMDFEHWLINGHVGMNGDWMARAPSWITTRNLSPLSLEAHIQDRGGVTHVGQIFQLEEIGRLQDWLSEKTGKTVALPRINSSTEGALPQIGDAARDAVRATFPMEAALYGM